MNALGVILACAGPQLLVFVISTNGLGLLFAAGIVVLAKKIAVESKRNTGPAWKCPHCHAQVPEEYDLCWQCRAPRRGN